MNIAYLTQSLFSVEKHLPINHNGMIDIFVLPTIDAKDITERNGNTAIHRYSTIKQIEDTNELRFKEIMRDLIAVHPSICYIDLKNEFGLMAYDICKHYGLQVQFISK